MLAPGDYEFSITIKGVYWAGDRANGIPGEAEVVSIDGREIQASEALCAGIAEYIEQCIRSRPN